MKDMINGVYLVLLVVFLGGVLYLTTPDQNVPTTIGGRGLSLPNAKWSIVGFQNDKVIFAVLNHQDLINNSTQSKSGTSRTGVWYERYALRDGRVFDLNVDLSKKQNELTCGKQVFDLAQGCVFVLRDNLSLTQLPMVLTGSHNKQETRDALDAIYVGYRSMNAEDRLDNKSNAGDGKYPRLISSVGTNLRYASFVSGACRLSRDPLSP